MLEHRLVIRLWSITALTFWVVCFDVFAQNIVVKGRIRGLDPGNVYITRVNAWGWPDTVGIGIVTNKRGRFNVALSPLKEPTFLTLRTKGQFTFLYLYPGDTIRLKTSFKAFDKRLKYKGDGAARNNYLANYIRKFVVGKFQNFDEGNRMPPFTFEEYVNFALNREYFELQSLKPHLDKHPNDIQFVNDMEFSIRYKWQSHLFAFPERYYYANGGTLPADYNYEVMQQIIRRYPIWNDNILHIPQYTAFVNDYADRLYRRNIDDSRIGFWREQLATSNPHWSQILLRTFTDSLPKGMGIYAATAFLVKYYLENIRTPGLDSLHTLLTKTYPNETSVKYLQKFRTEKTSNLTPFGYRFFPRLYPIHPVTKPANDTLSLQTLLQTIDKPIYIMVWASWCEACKKDLLTLLDLQNSDNPDLSNNIILLNADEHPKTLKTFLAKSPTKHNPLTSVRLVQGLQSALLRDLNLGLPGYFVVDKLKVRTTNPPKPTDPSFLDYLKSLK